MEIKDIDLQKACAEVGADFDVLRGKKCPYCKQPTKYVDSIEVYGKSYGFIYLCRPCDAFVGVHHGNSTESKGSVANKQLREWRKRAHQAFDPIQFQNKKNWNRNKAYSWLSEQMGLPKTVCHIGMFSINKCKKVIEICRNYSEKQF